MPKVAFLSRIARSLRWLGWILGVFFIGKYAYTIVTSALFYDFNIWNWFFSPDIAYTLLGLGIAVLLNCIGRVYRAAPLELGATFQGTPVKPKGVLKFVILLTLAVMLVLIIGHVFFLPRATTIVYPVICYPMSETDPTCSSYQATYQHAFNVKQGRQSVISWTNNARPFVYLVHRACQVTDKRNWECRSVTGQEIFGEEDGDFYEYGTDESYYQKIYEGMFYVTKEEWEELNSGPEPITYRTTPLICYLTGEFCYGL